MITRLEEISVTKESYPFASAERYLKLSERGYVEHVTRANHANLLGKAFADPIVRGVEHVLAAG